MSYYRLHLFFCVNERAPTRQCCQQADAKALCQYAKQQIKARNLAGPGNVRISHSGCMGRCAQGPTLVIYPAGVWYRYENTQDIDEIIEEHVVHGRIVTHLLIPDV